MRRTNKINYPMDYQFSVQELSRVVPDDIYRWMCFKVYGTEEPGRNEKPIYGTSNSLATYKKHLSYFFNAVQITAWNAVSKTGNPSRSVIVNDLIALVKKKECRGLGKESQADRAFEKSEFKQLLDILMSSNEFDRRYRYSTMLKFMFHLIGRGDDASHVFQSTLEVSSQYPWALTTRLRWSKNVRDRRRCPLQILLGSIDPTYCVMLALFAKVVSTQRTGIDTQNTVTSHYTEISHRLRRMERNVERTAMFRGARTMHGAGGVRAREDQLTPAILSKCPRTVYDLWVEYTVGTGGNKPACQFTTKERGKVKFKYCRRKIVWDVILNMCNRQLTADVAIDRIYSQCGGIGTPVNRVISELKRFKKEGNQVLFMTAGR